MSDPDDELRQLRHRLDDLERSLNQVARGQSVTDVAILGIVWDDGAMPESVPNQFAVHLVKVAGSEEEGSAVSVTASTSDKTIFYVLGSAVPQVGDVLIGYLDEGRWIARKDVAAGVTIVVKVLVCGAFALPDAEVALKSGGSTVSSGTSDSEGLVTLTAGGPGEYQIEVAHLDFTTREVDYTATAGENETKIVMMEPCGAMPDILYLSGPGVDSIEIHVEETIGLSGAGWVGVAYIPTLGTKDVDGTCTVGQEILVKVEFSMFCSGEGFALLIAHGAGGYLSTAPSFVEEFYDYRDVEKLPADPTKCPPGTDQPVGTGSNGDGIATLGNELLVCDPLSITFEVTFAENTGWQNYMYGDPYNLFPIDTPCTFTLTP